MFSEELLSVFNIRRMTGSSFEFAKRYHPHLVSYMGKYRILETPERLAAFMATIRVESAGLQSVEEGLYYEDPLRLATLFRRVFDVNKNKRIDQDDIDAAKPYARNPAGLSKILYNGYHGRGLIQLTWLSNYQAFSNASGVDCVNEPDLLLEPEYATHSACWFFETRGCNKAADSGTMDNVTRIVNPAMLHRMERNAAYAEALAVLASL